MRAAPRRLLFALAALAMLLAALAAWVSLSESAARMGLERVAAATGGRLALQGIEGRLVNGLRVRRIDWNDGRVRVGVDEAELRWSWRSLFDGRIAIGLLRADAIEIDVARSPGADREARAMPGAIGLPVAVLVGRIEAGRIELRLPEREPMTFTSLSARAAHLPGEYRVEALRVDTPWGDLAAESLRLGTDAPHPVIADASLLASADRLGGSRLRGDAPPIAIAATAAGDLRVLRIEARARVGQQRLRARLALDPLASALAADPALLEFDGVDPSAWMVDAPRARLGGRVMTHGADPSRGRVEIDNAAAGALSADAVPITSLRGDFAFEAGTLRMDELEIGLLDDGRLEGELTADPGRTIRIAGRELPAASARFSVMGLDPAHWVAAARSTRIDGDVALAGDELTAQLRERGASLAGRAALSVELAARLGETEIRLERARIAHGESGLDASGTIRLEPLALELAGEARGVDPAQWLELDDPRFGRFTRGRINGRWRASGAPGHGDLALSVELGDSRLAGASLAGRAEAVLDSGMRVSKLDADLALGGNRLTAHGAIGSAESLRWTVDAGEPGLFDERLEGRIAGAGEFGLAAGRPWGSGQLEGTALAFDGRIRADSARVRLSWPREAGAAFDAGARFERLELEGLVVDAASLQVEGPPSGHRFAVALRAAGQRLELGGRGAYDDDVPRWAGTIDRGRVDGTESVVVAPGARLEASPENVTLTGWRLQAPDGRGASATIERLDWRPGEPPRLATEGAVSGLPLARALAWLDRLRGRPGAGGDVDAALAGLRVDGQWRLDGGITAQTVAGEVRLSLREVVAGGEDQRLGIGEGSGARLRIDGGRLDGRIDLGLPSLVFLRRYLGEDWAVEGRLRIAADVGGTLDAPQLDGSLTGDRLAIEQRSQGWRLDRGELRAAFDGNGLVIERFRIASGEGDITVAGRAEILPDAERDPGEPGRSPAVPLRGEFDVEARRFRAPLDPGQRLVISGRTRLASDGRRMTLTGKVAADEGLIELRSAGVPELPDDIRIVGAPGRAGDEGRDGERRRVDTGGMQVGADIEIDLGREIRIVGGGIDTRLEGLVRLRGELPGAPRIEGTVRVRDGTFEAYGQRLDITSGSIRFNGPVDNPSLDITAVRPRLPIEVGVRLTGTALSPRIALFSNPEVPDAEKLSWLVLGVPLADASSGAQALALQQAAATLFGSDGGTMTGSLDQQLGVDVLGLGYASSTGQTELVGSRLGGTGLPGSTDSQDAAALREVVTIGKRLSSGVYLSYEQGLQGAWNLLRIQYDISRRLTLQLQTGSESAIDLLLQYWFD